MRSRSLPPKKSGAKRNQTEIVRKGLFAAGEYIVETARPIGEKRDGSKRYEPHVEYMIKAIDTAIDLVGATAGAVRWCGSATLRGKRR